jgi:transposase
VIKDKIGCDIPETTKAHCRGFMGENKNPEGRPSKYNPLFCDKVIELGKIGASKVEMACELDICRTTFDNYEKEYPEFLKAVKQAVMFSQAFWEKNGRLATFGGTPNFNATTWIFNMKNRFSEDWKDKTESSVDAKLNGTLELKDVTDKLLSYVPQEVLEASLVENKDNN